MSTKPEEEESGPQSPVPGGVRSFQGPQLGGVLQTTINSTQESDQRPAKQIITQESVKDQENVQAKEKLVIDRSVSHQETNSGKGSRALVVGLPPEPRRSRPHQAKVDKIIKDQPQNPNVIDYQQKYEELNRLYKNLKDKHEELQKADQAKSENNEELKKSIQELKTQIDEKEKRIDDLENRLIKLKDEVESMKLQQRSPDPFPNKIKIGEGSTDGTVVYKAKDKDDTNLTVDVAVKRMIADKFDKNRRKRYERESGLLKQSQDNCDNVVKYYRDFYTDDFFYLVMEYCDFTLYDHIQAENHAIETKVDWLRQAMNGVQHIHSLKIAHRDLKPHNILLRKQSDGSFKVKISDFGLSKQYRPNQTTSTARPKGTRGWAAPELHDAKKKKKGDDGRTGDIFTMGCVVYFVLTGSHLFGEDEDDRQRKIQMNEEPPMEQLASVPGCAAAEDLIRKMITFDPNPDQPLYSRLSTEEVRCHCFFSDVVDSNWTKHLLPQTKADEIVDGLFHVKMIDKTIKLGIPKDGSSTQVYKAKDREMDVAVKRMDLNCVDIQRVERELKLLQKSQCEHVVIYRQTRELEHYFFLVMELCNTSLYHFITEERFKNMRSNWNVVGKRNFKVDLLKKIMKGVLHLHSLSEPISHRDLKPHNILLCWTSNPDKPTVVITPKISDFGLSRDHVPDQTSTSGSRGTEGWAAPELFNRTDKRHDVAGDIFTMGCVITYFLTDGNHPFGKGVHRQPNILDNKFGPLTALLDEDYTAQSLIERMISHDPSNRPGAAEVLDDCFFLTEQEQFDFFNAVNSVLFPSRKPNFIHSLSKELDSHEDASSVVKKDWIQYALPRAKFNDLNKYQKDDRHKQVSWLINYVRNKCAHATDELEDSSKGKDVAEWIVNNNVGYYDPTKQPKHIVVTYFTTTFPKLLPHVFTVMEKCNDSDVQKCYNRN